MGLRPLARPTAREPWPVIPRRRAISPYVAVSPQPIVSSWSHTLRWKSVPAGRSGRSNSLRSRAKYASSWARASASSGSASSRSPTGSPRDRAAARLTDERADSPAWRGTSNSMAVTAPRCAITVSGPTGESNEVHMSFSLVLGHPEVHEGVGTPGPPTFGELGGAGRVLAERGEGTTDPEIGRQEHVGVAERTHRDQVSGPRPDPGQREQSSPHLGPVDTAVERQVAVGQRPAEPDQGTTAG